MSETLEVSRDLLAQLLIDIARATASIKALAKLHGKAEAKLLLKTAHMLIDIHSRIVEEIYGIKNT
jgi:hypothetical protein